MKIFSNFISVPVLSLVLLLGCAPQVELQSFSSLEAENLISQTNRKLGAHEIDQAASEVFEVELNLDAIASEESGIKNSIALNFSKDFDKVAEFHKFKRSEDSIVWIGKIKGEKLSSVILSKIGDQLTGTIETNGETYEIQPSSEGKHYIRRVNNAFIFDMEKRDHDKGDTSDEGPTEQPEEAAKDLSMLVGAAGDPVVDLLVLYTSDLQTRLGSQSAVKSFIEAAVAQTNQAYENSQVKATVRLVGIRNMKSIQTRQSAATLLPFIESNSTIASLRNNLGADLVTILTDLTDSCGRAGISLPGGYRAFSVVNYLCVSQGSFAHELGHNMGAHHDRFNATRGYFNYSLGYHARAYRTLMAYPRNNLPRVGVFSSPLVRFQNELSGTADEDNARTLNQVIPFLSRLKKSKQVSVNRAPIAAAGADRVMRVGASIRLSAAGSSDPDGDALSFSWKQISGPSVLAGNKNGVGLSFSPAAAGTYVFQVTVRDASLFGRDRVRVVVKPAVNLAKDLKLGLSPVSLGKARHVYQAKLLGQARHLQKVKKVIYKFEHFKNGITRLGSNATNLRFQRKLPLEPASQSTVVALVHLNSGDILRIRPN